MQHHELQALVDAEMERAIESGAEIDCFDRPDDVAADMINCKPAFANEEFDEVTACVVDWIDRTRRKSEDAPMRE